MWDAGSGEGYRPRCLGPPLAIGGLNSHLLDNEERKMTQASKGQHRASHIGPDQSTLRLTSGTSGKADTGGQADRHLYHRRIGTWLGSRRLVIYVCLSIPMTRLGQSKRTRWLQRRRLTAIACPVRTQKREPRRGGDAGALNGRQRMGDRIRRP